MRLGTDQIQQIEQQAMLITMANIKVDAVDTDYQYCWTGADLQK